MEAGHREERDDRGLTVVVVPVKALHQRLGKRPAVAAKAVHPVGQQLFTVKPGVGAQRLHRVSHGFGVAQIVQRLQRVFAAIYGVAGQLLSYKHGIVRLLRFRQLRKVGDQQHIGKVPLFGVVGIVADPGNELFAVVPENGRAGLPLRRLAQVAERTEPAADGKAGDLPVLQDEAPGVPAPGDHRSPVLPALFLGALPLLAAQVDGDPRNKHRQHQRADPDDLIVCLYDLDHG